MLDLIKNIVTKTQAFIKDESLDKRISKLLSNMDTFENYFAYQCSIELNNNMNNIIKTWQDVSYERKNHAIYKMLIEDYFGESDLKEGLLDIYVVQPNNVALADVYTLFERFKELGITDGHDFIYAMKIFYSLELQRTYLKALRLANPEKNDNKNAVSKESTNKEQDSQDNGSNKDIDLNHYLILLNSYCIPHDILFEISKESKQKFKWVFEYDKDKYEHIKKNEGEKQTEVSKEEKSEKNKEDKEDKEENKEENKESIENVYREVVNYMCYMNLSSQSDIVSVARKKIRIGQGVATGRQINAYKYRNVFTYEPFDLELSGDKKARLTDSRTYEYDIFGFLGNKEYILKSINRIIEIFTDEDSGLNEFFILRSLFDIDRLLASMFTRRTEDNPIKYAINHLISILNNNSEKSDIRNVNKLKTQLIFNNLDEKVDKIKYDQIYSNGVIDFDFNSFDLSSNEFKNDRNSLVSYNQWTKDSWISKIKDVRTKEEFLNLIEEYLKINVCNKNQEDRLKDLKNNYTHMKQDYRDKFINVVEESMSE